MNLLRFVAVLVISCGICAAAAKDDGSDYAGSAACKSCHPEQFEQQSNTAHAHALRRAQPSDPSPGSHAEWAFGAGVKATTWVTQTDEETAVEHGLSYYTATKSLAVTPGHDAPTDTVYRIFDASESVLRCFRCHSTGPLSLGPSLQIQPNELGVRCENCHGPGRAHVESHSARTIQNPGRLSALQINTLCGACHREATDLDDGADWSNAWNVRHEPRYLHRAACFRNSGGALSCLTCHDPHQPQKRTSAFYDSRCTSCHAKVAHTSPVASGSCTGCHMPRVKTSPNLTFTNHWIGIYDPHASKLIPAKRAVVDLRAMPGQAEPSSGLIVPADVSTLTPVYVAAVAARERQAGPESEKVARAASNLGLFLQEIGKSADAEAPLRRALAIDEQKTNQAVDADRESLALALEAEGKAEEALALFRRAAEGNTPAVSARSYVKLAVMDRQHADNFYRAAIAAEEKGSGAQSPEVAVLLQEYALALRAGKRDDEAEPLLRRALAIERVSAKLDPQVLTDVLNTLGNLIEGRGQFDEAERLERTALALAQEKFGPESPQLAAVCTNLADVLWNKKELPQAGQFYRRAIAIDKSLYGPERPETAADIANLGMLLNDAGQSAESMVLLKQALAIYQKTLGPDSDEAKLVKENLLRLAH
ncbi:MAG TPA: tetratricopeptide repeat protein [Bryobacteraceae bacterium]|jgi:tetratricopeptide (TPR) repeat protein